MPSTEPSTGLPPFTTTAVTTITATMTSADLVEGQVKNLNEGLRPFIPFSYIFFYFTEKKAIRKIDKIG